MDEVTTSGDDSASSDSVSLFGKSSVTELEESLNIEVDLKLREVGGAASAPVVRSSDARYELLGTIGQGGMGKVSLAYDHDLKRRVAFKVLKESDLIKPAMVRRFLEEAQATGQLEHPNIVPVYDVGRSPDGQTYYTMRFVQGISLEQVLRALRRGDREIRAEYTVTRFLQIIEQVAMAVHFAHEKGVIHRDLKPSNIMLGDYGEVFVMDWGLAKIMGREAESGKKRLIGTPAYMSPEQAAGQEALTRSDVFSLGAIMYRCLTLRVPFHGLTLQALLADIRRASPAPARRFNSRLPPELDRITLQALAKNPDDRFATARAMRDAIQGFLEGVAERRRQRARAEGIAGDGRRRAAQCLRLLDDLRELNGELTAVEAATPTWLSLDEKTNLIELRRRVEEKSAQAEQAFSAAVEVLTKALAQDATLRSARGALAELYFRRFMDAETEGDNKESQFFRRLVESFHDGKYAKELKGDGSLEIASEPPGAEVILYRLREKGLVLVPDDERRLGTAPVTGTLPMGSYSIVLRLPGYADVRYPVSIGRLGEWSGVVPMYKISEVGEGFVYVPGGPMIQGGDRGTMTSLPRAEPEVPGFFVSRHPVTNAEYLEFLNDLAEREPEEAVRRAPRRGDEGAVYWSLGPDGFHIPEVDKEGDRHDPRWPVLAISWNDAVAYCEWRSVQDGREYVLPTELEWEKAARGVDGRTYPWGNRFDPALCNMAGSRRRAGPVPVGSFTTDRSPYGVEGMAGNCEEWTSDEMGDRRGSRVARGGSWRSNAVVTRCAYRSSVEPHLASGIRGFRLISREPKRSPKS